MNNRSGFVRITALRAALGLVLVAGLLVIVAKLITPATARSNVLQDVQFNQRINEPIPLNLEFRDSNDRPVKLAQYFGRRPVVLSLVYYECPMLCTLELNGLVRSLRTLSMSAGEEFELVTVSFDHGETPQLAAAKKAQYVAQYERPSAEQGWHFLTGEQANIERLCEAVGFRYVYDPERDEYAHASGIVVLTPGGKIFRYFYGIDYPPKTLRLGIVESSEGRLGSATDQLMLMCYGYDPATGEYGLLVMNIIRLGGALTICVLAAFIGTSVYREKRNERAREQADNEGEQE
jgi:protein SCO1